MIAGPANTQAFRRGGLGPFTWLRVEVEPPQRRWSAGGRAARLTPRLRGPSSVRLMSVEDYATPDTPFAEGYREALGSGSFDGFARSMDGGACRRWLVEAEVVQRRTNADLACPDASWGARTVDGHGRRIPAGRRYKVQAARRSIVRAIFFRARKIRFMTVPIGTFSVSAISRYFRSW